MRLVARNRDTTSNRNLMRLCLIVLSLCWASSLAAQSAPPTDLPLAGCYEVRVLKRTPRMEDETHFPPSRLQLTEIPLDGDKTGFVVQSIPVAPSGSTYQQQWFWVPQRGQLRLSLGLGMGGFRGSFGLSTNGDLSGKLKEWCDNRCGFKKTVIAMNLHRIECPK